MRLQWKRVDASLLCFALVVVAAVPVAALRSKTYSIGYELGRLKSEEKLLRQRNIDLQSQLAAVQRNVRDNRLKTTTVGNPSQLDLPSKSNVLRAQPTTSVSENPTGEKPIPQP